MSFPGAFLVAASSCCRGRRGQAPELASAPKQEEAKRPEARKEAAFEPLLEGKTLKGWEVRGPFDNWALRGGVVSSGGRTGMLVTEKRYGDFEAEPEWKVPARGEGGVLLRLASLKPPKIPSDGFDLRLTDNPQPVANDDPPKGPKRGGDKGRQPLPFARSSGPDQWNRLSVRVVGSQVRVTNNNAPVTGLPPEAPIGGLPAGGAFGLHSLGGVTEFRNVRVKSLR